MTPDIIQSPSPNFYSRQGHLPSLLVIHCTDGHAHSDLHWLQNPNPPGGVGPVSAHFYIAPDGAVHQLVGEAMAAWHAGRVLDPTARLLKKTLLGQYINPNWYTIGIEVSLKPPAMPTSAQWTSLKKLVKYLVGKHGISLDRDHVVGHREIFIGKLCPAPIDVNKLVAELTSFISTDEKIKSILEQVIILLQEFISKFKK